MLKWIVWNRTIFIKRDLALNNLQRLICHKTQPTNQTNKFSPWPAALLWLKKPVCFTIYPRWQDGFIPFQRALVLCEIQTTLLRIWTRVTVFISYNCKHYPTNTSLVYIFLYILSWMKNNFRLGKASCNFAFQTANVLFLCLMV